MTLLMNLNALAEDRIRRNVEGLAVSILQGPPAATTPAGTPYITLINGQLIPEAGPAPFFHGTLEELIRATIDGAVDYAETIGGRINLIWRAMPQIEEDPAGQRRTYMRLAFEPVKVGILDTSASASVAAVASIDEPNMHVVHELERLLALAVSGDLRAVGYVTVRKAGIVGSGWAGAEDGHLHTLTSGAARLAQRLTADEGH